MPDGAAVDDLAAIGAAVTAQPIDGPSAGPGAVAALAEPSVPAEPPSAMAEGGGSRRAAAGGSALSAAPATFTANTNVPTAPAAASSPTPVSASRRPGTRS
jgi:hypothetical protein